MAALAKQILLAADTEEYDLDGFGPDDCDELAAEAFKNPIPCPKMFRVTFVVGGGKKVRQKYSPDLPKFLSDALRAVGYEEDKGAAVSLDSQGKFKYQHDTGKDLKYIHVFPFVKIQEESDGTMRIAGYRVDDMPPEIKCTLCEMETFKDLVKQKCPTFTQKRCLLKAMKGVQGRFEEFEQRMAALQPLTAEEQELYEGQVAMAEKVDDLTKQVQVLLDSGKVSKAEAALLLTELTEKLKKAEKAIKDAEAEGKKTTKLEAQREALAAQLEKLRGATPITYKKKNEKEIVELKEKIERMREQLTPLNAIQDAEAKMERLKQEQEGWYWAAVAREDKVSSLPKKKK
eukprot:EG_transcript_17168